MKQFPVKGSFALLAAIAATSGQSQNAFGIAFNGDLYKVNVSTGAGSHFLNTGITGPNCMAKYQSAWYTVDNSAALWRIHDTGARAIIYTLNLGGATDVRGLAFDTNSTMFAVVNKAGSDELWSINAVNGLGTLVGPMGSSNIQGLTCGYDGKLYAYDVSTTNSGGLRVVDRLTGATTDLNPAAPGQPGIQDLFPSGARIMGGRDTLFDVNVFTGTESAIGSGGYADVRGWARNQTVHHLNTAIVRLGQLFSGTVASLRHRDANSFVVNKFIVPNQQVDPINVEVTSLIALNHAQTTDTGVMWVGRTNTSGSFRLSVDVLNRTTGIWDPLGVRTINTTVSEQSFTRLGSMAAYYDNNEAIFRFRVKPNGPVGTAAWGVETDMLRVEAIESF